MPLQTIESKTQLFYKTRNLTFVPMEKKPEYLRKPDWLKIKLPAKENYAFVKDIVAKHKLHTICSSGNCPNVGECWDAGTATFMILGNICTRACKFCAVETGKPLPPDLNEAQQVAESIQLMGLKHCVITSVDRDDLMDGGASIWADCIRKIKELNPDITIETLIPDFNGIQKHLQLIIDEKPTIISHNLETVERLTPLIRTKAQYQLSLEVIRYISSKGIRAKSGIMLGLGETDTEVIQVMDDLRECNCSIITIGQYLQPSRQHYPVKEYVVPEKYKMFEELALQKGFLFAECNPLVRSSFHAEKHIK